MKTLTLRREQYTDTETLGVMTVGDTTLHTLERPWIPTAPGGKSRESCVPCGVYQLKNHRRPTGAVVPALINHGLGVYHQENDRVRGCGRFLILIHVGNHLRDIVGCIAPGMGEAISDKGPMVTSSAKAMKVIIDYIGDDEAELIIEGGSYYA